MESPTKQSQLELDTAAYFANMTEEEEQEERTLENRLAQSVAVLDIDVE